jgi:hypothetical protein
MRLPSVPRMWEHYRFLANATGGIENLELFVVGFGEIVVECTSRCSHENVHSFFLEFSTASYERIDLYRKMVSWINSEAVVFGGKQVSKNGEYTPFSHPFNNL